MQSIINIVIFVQFNNSWYKNQIRDDIVSKINDIDYMFIYY